MVAGRAEAERVIAGLHQAGGIDIPREFVIMDLVAIGLGAAFLQLHAKVNWHRLMVCSRMRAPTSTSPSCSETRRSCCKSMGCLCCPKGGADVQRLSRYFIWPK